MIEVDKKYDYKQLQDIIASAAAKSSESFRDVLCYARLMSTLFQDEIANKELKEELDAELKEQIKLGDEIAKAIKNLEERLNEIDKKDKENK